MREGQGVSTHICLDLVSCCSFKSLSIAPLVLMRWDEPGSTQDVTRDLQGLLRYTVPCMLLISLLRAWEQQLFLE